MKINKEILTIFLFVFLSSFPFFVVAATSSDAYQLQGFGKKQEIVFGSEKFEVYKFYDNKSKCQYYFIDGHSNSGFHPVLNENGVPLCKNTEVKPRPNPTNPPIPGKK